MWGASTIEYLYAPTSSSYISHQNYADDTQLYNTTPPGDSEPIRSLNRCLDRCVDVPQVSQTEKKLN